MKKNFFLFALIPTLIAAIVFLSCRKGEKGDPGIAGTSSTLAYKNGSITGLLEGVTNTNDSAFALNLNYQYYKEASDNFVNHVHGTTADYYEYSITRYDVTGNSYITFDFFLEYKTPLVPSIRDTRITIVSHKQLSNNKMFYFATVVDNGFDPINPFNVSDVSLNDNLSSDYSGIVYDNIAVDPTTGALSFDYSLQVNPYRNSSGTVARMTGTVNVTPYNVVYRTGSVE